MDENLDLDFDQWWKRFGRFIPPLDKINDLMITRQFEAVAKEAWDYMERVKEEYGKDRYNDGYSDGQY